MLQGLPQVIAAYLAAENDSPFEAEWFSDQVVVRDEGRLIQGLEAVLQWKAESKEKYQQTHQALAFFQDGGRYVVTSRVRGNFPGSPLDLQFVFALEDSKISSLEVR